MEEKDEFQKKGREFTKEVVDKFDWNGYSLESAGHRCYRGGSEVIMESSASGNGPNDKQCQVPASSVLP